MDDNQKKVAVVVVGIVITAAIVGWRSMKALREVREAQQGGEPGETVVVSPEAHAPAGFQPVGLAEYLDEPHLPYFKLGTIKVRNTEQHIRMVFAGGGHHRTEEKPARDLGANAIWHTAVTTNAPDLELGNAEASGSLLLVYVTDVPDDWRSRLAGVACWVTFIHRGTASERGGLKVDDLLVDVNHERAGGKSLPDCEVAKEMKALPAGQPITVTVLRDGKPVDLTMVREGERFGYNYNLVPVFPAGTTQLPL